MIATPKSFPDGGEEYAFEFLYEGKRISITLALNRSGENYWRPEYPQKADLVVIHDPGEGASPKLFAELSRERERDLTQAPPLILVEGREKDSDRLLIKPDRSFYEIQGQYGHCAMRVPMAAPRGLIETGMCEHASALLVVNR